MMSIVKTHRNLEYIARAATLEGAKPGVTVITPWRVNANQDHLHEGLDECGCGFCPDDEETTTSD